MVFVHQPTFLAQRSHHRHKLSARHYQWVTAIPAQERQPTTARSPDRLLTYSHRLPREEIKSTPEYNKEKRVKMRKPL